MARTRSTRTRQAGLEVGWQLGLHQHAPRQEAQDLGVLAEPGQLRIDLVQTFGPLGVGHVPAPVEIEDEGLRAEEQGHLGRP